MIEDKILIWRFCGGSPDALEKIYLKYYRYLLTLACALLNDVHAAEDTVHDFFVSFAASGRTLKLEGSLKAYLATCVANKAKDRLRALKLQSAKLKEAALLGTAPDCDPNTQALCNEAMQLVNDALTQLPYDQREVVILHTKGGMRFRTIASHQKVPIQTVQSRYRYGLEKLRTLLNGQVQP